MFVKKNLIAVAALATLAVSAQAQSSVTLYGNLDAALAYSKVKQGGSSESVNSVESSILTESFFGLKGQEDLGGGLKAVFKLESFIDADTGSTGTSNFWGKNAYVGLAGDFGTVALGNQESLFKLQGNAFNPFGASSLLSTTNVLFTGLTGLGGSWQNTVGYTSANLSGLTLSAQHSAKEGAKATATNYNGNATAVAANYVAGPLAASLVYGDVRSTTASATDTRQRAYLLGASYDFGVVKAFAQYGQDKVEVKNEAGSDKAKFYQLGAVVPVSQAGSVHASFGQTKVEGFKTHQFSLAYNHALSKRTGVYAGVTYIKDDILGRLIAEEEEAAYAGKTKTTAVAVGLRHAF